MSSLSVVQRKKLGTRRISEYQPSSYEPFHFHPRPSQKESAHSSQSDMMFRGWPGFTKKQGLLIPMKDRGTWKTQNKMSPRASGSTEEHGELPPPLDYSLCSSCMCVQLCWLWWGSALTSHFSVKGESSPLEAGSFLGLVSQTHEMRKNYQYRVTEYIEFEGTHQNHQIQLLALCKTQQESYHMSESVVQMKYSKNKASLIINSWDLCREEYDRMSSCRENSLWINIILHMLITLLVYYFY